MEFGQKKFRQIDLFDFTSLLAWTFLNFLTCYAKRAAVFGLFSTNSSAQGPIFELRARSRRPTPALKPIYIHKTLATFSMIFPHLVLLHLYIVLLYISEIYFVRRPKEEARK